MSWEVFFLRMFRQVTSKGTAQPNVVRIERREFIQFKSGVSKERHMMDVRCVRAELLDALPGSVTSLRLLIRSLCGRRRSF